MAMIGDGAKREHDMSVLSRQSINEIRQNAPKGTKVLYVWDRASIGFDLWEKLKRQGVYFITRSKKGLKFTEEEELSFDKDDEVNQGVLYDQMVRTKTDNHLVRRVIYQCPLTGETFSFLTNLHKSIRPGLVAFLYRMRWEVEKVFDEIKNKWNEKKSWSSDENGKVAQATFICITHNLLTLFEDKIEEEGVENKQDEERREERLEKGMKKRKIKPEKVSVMIQTMQRVTQRSLTLIRWLRDMLVFPAPWDVALELLRRCYAEFSR